MFHFNVQIKGKSKKVLMRHMLSVMKSMVNDYYEHDTEHCKYQLEETSDEPWASGDLERITK